MRQSPKSNVEHEVFLWENVDFQGQRAVQAFDRVVELLFSSKRRQFLTSFQPEHNVSVVHLTLNISLTSVARSCNFDTLRTE